MNEIVYAPVVLFAYNRPEHLRKTLEALDNNIYAEKSNLYVFSDGYKNDKDRENVEAVREVLNEYRTRSRFKELHVFESACNNGLAASVIKGVTQVIDEFGKVVVIEDDLITSVDFLKYMNGALNYYENEPRVWSIAGYTPGLKCLKKYDKDVYMCMRAGSWGWATWKDRWDTVDWEVSDYDSFANDKKMRKEFSKRGYYMLEMLDLQMQGKVDSWAIRFCYEQFKQNKVTVNPTVSRIKNTGVDGSGTHKVKEDKWAVELNDTIDEIGFIPCRINKRLVRAYYNFFAGNIYERSTKRIKDCLHNIMVRIRQ